MHNKDALAKLDKELIKICVELVEATPSDEDEEEEEGDEDYGDGNDASIEWVYLLNNLSIITCNI